MKITPLDPTKRGAVTVYLARPMKYDEAPGQSRKVYVNSSKGINVAVMDITPPTSGLEVSVDGKKGSFWAVENPLHCAPPKRADVILRGALFSKDGQPGECLVANLYLGDQMAVPVEEGALYVEKNAELSFQVILQDNDKVDEKSLQYGVCQAPNGGDPLPVGPINPQTLSLSKLKLPKGAHVYIDIKDVAGNRQGLYIPLKVK